MYGVNVPIIIHIPIIYILMYMWCVACTDLSANIYAICIHPILGNCF